MGIESITALLAGLYDPPLVLAALNNATTPPERTVWQLWQPLAAGQASDGPRLRRKVVNLAPREAVTRGQRSANVHNVEGTLTLRSIADVRGREYSRCAKQSRRLVQPDQPYHSFVLASCIAIRSLK